MRVVWRAGRDRRCVLAQLLQVKYAGTSGVWIEKMGEDEVVMTLKNRLRSALLRVRASRRPRSRRPPPPPPAPPPPLPPPHNPLRALC